MKPSIKQFTKDNPCTKADIWAAFSAKGSRRFRRVQKDEAHAVIGVNAPRNMLDKGYVTVVEARNAEYYELTEKGKEWLSNGIKSFLKNHPNRLGDVQNLPKSLMP